MSSGPRKLRSHSTATRTPSTKPPATSRRAPTQAPAAAPAEDAAATAAAVALAAACSAAPAAAAAPTMPPTPTKSADTSATLRSTSSNHELFKYTVQNIPQAFARQKKFFEILTTHLLLNDIDTLKVNYNRSCLLITRNELPASFENRLRVATLDARITIKPINRPKKTQTPAKKSPLFSIVIKDVDQDIEERDILISAPHLKVHKMWRIISRKTNKPTALIRLIFDDVITIDTLLTDGIVFFGRLHRCEPSNAPPPTPVQCSKCFTLGYQASECSQKPICPRCTGTHAPNKCPKEDPECPFCKGSHPAWSRKCPEFVKLTVTDETQTLPTIIIDPPTEFADPVDITDEAPEEVNLSQINAKAPIAFVTKTLFGLLPLNRPKTQQAIQDASLAIFNLKTRINHSGRLIHFTFDA
ncbi:hypothetical protein Zmor_027956 [Zophobas morio]|uniref:Gag-like protein n=1 Tax=Zophobas morio TaxID=2755281 RepID=A0AA38HQ33_9CUCU|nr:hypothetical protein Zmor_027956 [Zophobas morio]